MASSVFFQNSFSVTTSLLLGNINFYSACLILSETVEFFEYVIKVYDLMEFMEVSTLCQMTCDFLYHLY